MICLLYTYVSLDVKLVQLTGRSVGNSYGLLVKNSRLSDWHSNKIIFHLCTSQTKYRLKYTFASRLARDIPGSTVVKCDIN